VVRTVINALNLFAPGVKAFSRFEIQKALIHAQVAAQVTQAVLDVARSLARQLGGSKVVSRIAAT
jgi:hypothetical protein